MQETDRAEEKPVMADMTFAFAVTSGRLPMFSLCNNGQAESGVATEGGCNGCNCANCTCDPCTCNSDTTGVGARQEFSIVALHTCLIAFVTVFGFCLQLKFPNVSPYEIAYGTLTMNLFITVICFYIGSLAGMAIQAARNNADLVDLVNKFSLLLGTLALIVELLFLFSPLGWISLFFWCICLSCFLSNSCRSLNTLYHSAVAHIVQDFGELRQKLFDLNRGLMESNAAAVVGRAYQNLKDMIIRNDGRITENGTQNQNHTTEHIQNDTSGVPVSIV